MNTLIENNRFEITKEDIALLDDATLRDLIGLLCEADCRMSGLSGIDVAYGGHQDASDGGVDVLVKTDHPLPKNVAIPRSYTGFQVKKPAMPRKAILAEMKPKGILRPFIQGLIKNGGAYIIVSSGDSTTASSLNERVMAMKEAVSDQDSDSALFVDFYDRNRIATWVRMHHSLVLWVRDKIGRPLTGWHPYDNWAKCPEGVEEEYLIDEGLYLRDDTQSQSQNPNQRISIQEGLDKIRQRILMPRSVVRLVGLSGVGKTRLVQALFDTRIGESALNQSTAFYTDMSDSPHPPPQQFAEQLIAENAQGTLVIDNCPPDLHQRLAALCAGQMSRLSLLTVEYDVSNETLSDETNVFRLEPSSEELITKVIRKRFPHINQINADTISKASGGNYRIGIAIADTVKKGENLTGLNDIQLFKRLFEQQQGSSDKLILSAEVLSLVYSFDGIDTTSDNSELKILASLIEKSVLEVYRDIAELQSRELIQSRSNWRAILPHAIANMLAKNALKSIPKETIIKTFLEKGTERLILSLSRRLGYLHDSPEAIAIVNELLAEGQWLGDVGNLNKFGLDVFTNFAPALPEKALEALERAAKNYPTSQFLSRNNPHFYEFVRILRSIAYDKIYFKRCVILICEFAISEKENENYNSIRSILKSLFYTYFSGTHAEETERLEVIEELLDSDNLDKQSLGITLLDVTLVASRFTSLNSFSFGGRKRDYGYHPNKEQKKRWYATFIKAAENIATTKNHLNDNVKKILATRFHDLWFHANMYDELESAAIILHQVRSWNEGWKVIKQMLSRYDKIMDINLLERLKKIERQLFPYNLIEKCRTYIFSNGFNGTLEEFELDIESSDDFNKRLEYIDRTIFELGFQVAQEPIVFNTILPDIISYSEANGLYTFGQGLAQGSKDIETTWMLLKDQVSKKDKNECNVQVFRGMIAWASINSPALCNSWLDQALHDQILTSWFPYLQCAVEIDASGLWRLNYAIDQNDIPIESYYELVKRMDHKEISDDDLSDLVNKIAAIENGQSIAIEILDKRFYNCRPDQISFSPKLLDTARKIISHYTLSKRSRRRDTDYTMANIAKLCLTGDDGATTASVLLHNLYVGLSDFSISPTDYTQLTRTITKKYPRIFLEVFLLDNDISSHVNRLIFSNGCDGDINYLDLIPDEKIISWCNEAPVIRYPIIASIVKIFEDPSSSNENGQWRSIILLIFKYAPDIDIVLNSIQGNLRPNSFGGSLSRIMERRLRLFPHLFNHENARISAWAKRTHENLQISIQNLLKDEEDRYRQKDERFEW
jgi:hypothetical protein